MKKFIFIPMLLTTIYNSSVFCINDNPSHTTIVGKGYREELVPSEISIPQSLQDSYSSDSSFYGESLPNKFKTFYVTPNYEILAEGGVKFTIEDVTLPLETDLNMAKINKEEYMERGALEVNLFYERLTESRYQNHHQKSTEQLLNDMEVFSEIPTNLVYSGSDGILAACVIAFARHLPLTLKPDHIWMLILHALCQNVNQNHGQLRSKFVNHAGKKKLNLSTPSLIKGSTPPAVWQTVVFPLFATKIKENLASEELYNIITADFSASNAIERSCKEILLMGITAKYFDFICYTVCGIPNITLLGSEEDWQSIIDRTEALSEYMTPEFKNFWMPKLKPVLEKFLDAFKGNIDYTFWQTMVKLRKTAGGSGSHSFISGWIQILFPYLSRNDLNRNMKRWNESYFTGPETFSFPNIMTSVPVLWQYYGQSFDMHYHAGIVGFSQNQKDGGLMPVEGWRISYDNKEHEEI